TNRWRALRRRPSTARLGAVRRHKRNLSVGPAADHLLDAAAHLIREAVPPLLHRWNRQRETAALILLVGCPLQALTLLVRMSRCPQVQALTLLVRDVRSQALTLLVRMSAPGFDSSWSGCRSKALDSFCVSRQLPKAEKPIQPCSVPHNCLHSAVHPRLLGAHTVLYLGRSLHGFVMLCSLGGFFGTAGCTTCSTWRRYIRESEDQFSDRGVPGDLSRFTSVPARSCSQRSCARPNRRRRTRGRLRDDYEALKRRLAGSIFFRDKLRDRRPGAAGPGISLIRLTLAAAHCSGRVPSLANIGVHQMSFTKLAICSYCSFVVYSTDFQQHPLRLTAHCLPGQLVLPRLAQPASQAEVALRRRACAPAQQRPRVTYEGESVPLREAVRNFFKSPLWREMRDTVGKLYEYYKIHGFKEILKQLWDALDPQGLKDAA
uniref:SEC7 domain-containing protein n=1 Tax=Macrostomum lignano TaxID=282301 RepID=A0A1I8FPA3_9PLAT